MTDTAGDKKKPRAVSNSNNMSYRENYRERPASPSEASVATIYDSILSSPPSPVDYGDDRLRNDLLDEICSDMGIHDSMDLDFYDFSYDNQDTFMMPAENQSSVPSANQKQGHIPQQSQQQNVSSSCMQNNISNVQQKSEFSNTLSQNVPQFRQNTPQTGSATDKTPEQNNGHTNTVHYKPASNDQLKPQLNRTESDSGYQSDLRSTSSHCSSGTNYSTSAYGSSDSLNAIFHLTRSITSDGVNFNAYNSAKNGLSVDDSNTGNEVPPMESPMDSLFQDNQARKSVSFSLPAVSAAQFSESDCPSLQHSPSGTNTNQGQFTFPPPPSLSHSNSAPEFQHYQQQPGGGEQYYQQQQNPNFPQPLQRSMSQDRQYRNSPSPSQLRQLGHYQKILPRPSQQRTDFGPYAVPSRGPYDRRRSDAENYPFMQGGGEIMSSFEEQLETNMHTVQQGIQQNTQQYGHHLPYEPPPPPYPYGSSQIQSQPYQPQHNMQQQQRPMESFQHQMGHNSMPQGMVDPNMQTPSTPTTPTQQNFGHPVNPQQRPNMISGHQQNPGFISQHRRPPFNQNTPSMMGNTPNMMNATPNMSMPSTNTVPPNSAEQSPQRIAALSQQNFMQRLVTDKSSAFRSHPLFPLLRDLVIADMNFEEPSFPYQLIGNLPRDFNKLLQNYLTRNPRRPNYQNNHAVESVIMDALKYAHHSLIAKIATKGAHMKSGPMNAVEEFCDRFDQDIRKNMPTNSILKESKFKIPSAPGQSLWGSPQKSVGGLLQTTSHMSSTPNMSPLTQNQMPSTTGVSWANPSTMPNMSCNMGQPLNQAIHTTIGQTQVKAEGSPMATPVNTQAPTDFTELKPMFQHPNSNFHMVNNGQKQHKDVDSYANNIPGGAQLVKTVLHNSQSSLNSGTSNGKLTDSESDRASIRSEPSTKSTVSNQTPLTQPKKHASLPKEAVAIMLDWLRAHMDKPYPNDDEKGMLIKQTGLSINQINYWFTNARRRVLPKWRGDDM